MTTVRPPVFPPSRPAPAGPQRADPAKLAAQKAFFEAALGNSGPTRPAAATAPLAASAASVRPPQVAAAAAPGPDQPSRILRPGSLIDIKV